MRIVFLPVALLATGLALFLLWTTSALEGKWLVAVLVGLYLPWLVFFFGNIEQFLQFLFVLLLPLQLEAHLGYEVLAAGARGFSLSACDLLLIGLYLMWIQRLLFSGPAERRIRWSPLPNLLFGLFFLANGLSTFQAVNPRFSYYELFQLLKMWLGFFYFLNNVNKQTLPILGIALSLSIILEAALAFGQYFFGTTLGLDVFGETSSSYLVQRIGYSQMERIGGTLGHPNGLAAFLIVTLPPVLSLFFADRRWWAKALFFSAFILGTVAMVLTFSRGGWISFMVVVFLTVLLGIWKQRGFLPACFALAGFTLLMSLIAVPFHESITQRLFEHDYGAAWSRIPQIKVAWNIIQSHPFFGIGLNNYNLVMERYDSSRITLQVLHPVHNMYLLIAAESGILSLVFFLLLIGTLFRRGWHCFWKGKGPSSFFSLGVFSALIGLLIHYLVEFHYLGSNYFFAFLMGLLGASKFWDERTSPDH